MKRFAVAIPGAVLGYSELPERDPSMGVAVGPFRPTSEYARVQPVFRLFVESQAETSAAPTDEAKLARYYAARDALGLELRDPAGRLVRTATIHIADYSLEAGPEALELEVVISDDGFWARD